MNLTGKVAIVTGGTRGIGEAVVRKLAAEGAAVAFSYLSSDDLARQLEKEVSAIGVRADVRDRDAVEALVGKAVDRFGGLDIVVNNAHRAYEGKMFEEAAWDDFALELDTLVKGPFNVVQAALPHLKARGGGVVVNVGSTMAETPRPRHSFYVTAKCALLGMTRAMAIELGDYGIRVNMVTPGPLVTDHNATYPEEVMTRLGQETPLHRRLGTCDEVGDAIVMLTMDEGRFVTGTNLLASGGFSVA
jgi:3-oxoacyl-[acyl-carrier protein] reductase